MAERRGDAELASVMRKLLRFGIYLDIGHGKLFVDATQVGVDITEDEAQALDEAVAEL